MFCYFILVDKHYLNKHSCHLLPIPNQQIPKKTKKKNTRTEENIKFMDFIIFSHTSQCCEGITD